jgi:OOP family OmpA-OmpF porin
MPQKALNPQKMTLKQILTPFAVITAISACSNAPTPSTSTYRAQGYLQDTAGNNAVIKSLGYQACVRTSDWTPARATVECDPDLAPPVAQAPAPRPVAPPAPVAPPPAPPKVVVQAPPPAPILAATPTPQRFTLSADALFAFDRTTLTPGGRKKLDDLADALSGTQHDTIVATGHTDRVGTAHYNQRLSDQRAATVKRYLQGKGLDVGKITASGKGNAQPVTKPDDCPRGKMPNTLLFACLQPDRRVEIEVSGSKVIDSNAAPVVKPADVKDKLDKTQGAQGKASVAKSKPALKAKKIAPPVGM